MGYDQRYDSPFIRSSSEVIPYAVHKLIVGLGKLNGVALDIGCGTCKKILAMSNYFAQYYAIDSNQLMIDKALVNINEKDISNIKPFLSSAHYLPFESSSLDFISRMLAPYSINEIHRTIRNDGVLFMEMLGADDKKAFKYDFGKDDLGNRGILLNTNATEREKYFYVMLKSYFKEIDIKNYRWNTSINKEGLCSLLEMTPTIRDFDLIKDKGLVDKLFKNDIVHEFITFEEHRMIITAKNKIEL